MEENYQQLLTFSIKNEQYGISILKIREVIGMMNIIKTPKAPDFIKGIINLRGDIIPVMDLRTKFGMEQQEYDKETCIIIASILINNLTKLFGIIIDKVNEVITISNVDIENAPQYGPEDNVISGIGKVKGRVIIILDINKIILSEDLSKAIEAFKKTQDLKEIQHV